MIPVVNVTEPSEWDEMYDIEFSFIKDDHLIYKCNNIITYDIETSNGFNVNGEAIEFEHDKYNNDEEFRKLIDNSEQVSCLYVWQMAIEWQNGIKVFMGRTWDDFIEFVDKLTIEIRRQAIYGIQSINRVNENNYALHSKHNVIMYWFIHNLGFEMQHLRNIWNDDFAGKRKGRKAKFGNVFARQARKPMKARVNHNRVHIEMRDTLVLTQKKLSDWCKDEKLPIKKLEEPDDYYLHIRTPLTKLTSEEIQYSINDVVCMVYGIEKYRDKYETLDKIPLTQTGITRALLRKNVCEANKDWANKCCEITRAYTPDDFKDLVHLFQGGWTHGNKMFINRIINNCRCFDLASSYPSVLSICTFPVGHFIDCDINEFSTLEAQDLDYPEYRWYAKIKLKNVRSKIWNSYWSLSKICRDENDTFLIKGQIVDNGRIYKADEMTILLTDLDWDTFKQCYSYNELEVISLRKSEAGFMPKEFILTILDYFKIKTSLKGDESDPTIESKYRESKSIFNAFYGCSVTKIVTDQIEFEIDGWNKTPCDDNIFYDAIINTKPEQSFSCYQHGIWVTSHARHNLFQFIINLDKRIAYCDTDSIKGPFNEKDIDFIKKYNDEIEKKQEYVANHYGFDKTLYTAKTMKGKTKRLGVMEEEDPCSIKVLGAKRYVEKLDEDGTIICTIAGLPKSAGSNKIKKLEDFNDKTFWNTKESQKLMAVYNDEQSDCYFIDRDGNKYLSRARYGICLQPTTFDLSIGDEFRKFLEALSTGEMDREVDEFYNDTTKYLL